MQENLFLFTGWIASLFTDNEHVIHAVNYAGHLVLVAVIVLIAAKFATKNLQLVPRGTQNILEAYLEGVVSSEALSRKYLPLVATIGLIVFVSNIIGIIPGFEAPTSSLNLTLTLALVVFVFYHYEGIRANGVIKYFAHFMGPNKWLAPIMFIVEIVSHLSRVVSLSFRLFGNIKGDDLFLLVVLALASYAALPAFVLLTFMACLQTFIFMIITYVYLAGAILISHDEH